jgi:hypothetical protein
MRRTVVQSTFVALIVTALGCQSGPRWAWWKKDTPMADSSAVARSAEPVLPSSQSTPTAVTATGIQPATPPSSANLAAAGTTAPTAGTSIYPTTGAPPIAAAGTLATAGSAIPIAGAMPRTTPIATAPAPNGPYNPNAYQPAATTTATNTNPASAGGDRYGTVPVANTAATTERYGVPAVASPNPVSTAGAPPVIAGVPAMAPSSADRYGILPVAGPATAAAPSAIPGYATSTPEAGTAYVPATATQVTTTPAGQYRPAGTSDYVGGPAGSHVEIATRPATPPAAPVSTSPPSTYPTSPYGATQPY